MPRGLGKHVRRSVRSTGVHLDFDRKQNLGPPVLGSTSLFYYMTLDAGCPVLPWDRSRSERLDLIKSENDEGRKASTSKCHFDCHKME